MSVQPSKIYVISFQTLPPPSPKAETWEDLGGRRGSREPETRGAGGDLLSLSPMQQGEDRSQTQRVGTRGLGSSCVFLPIALDGRRGRDGSLTTQPCASLLGQSHCRGLTAQPLTTPPNPWNLTRVNPEQE